MTQKAFISDLTWRSRDHQLKKILAAMGNPNPDNVPVYDGAGDIPSMLRSTTRSSDETIYVASLAVIAKTENSFRNFLKLCLSGGRWIKSVEENFLLKTGRHDSVEEAVRKWRVARTNGAAKIGGGISARKKEDATKTAIELIRADWPKPSEEFSTQELLDRANISLNTAKKHLGRRPIAQANYQAKLKRRKRNELAVWGTKP